MIRTVIVWLSSLKEVGIPRARCFELFIVDVCDSFNDVDVGLKLKVVLSDTSEEVVVNGSDR